MDRCIACAAGFHYECMGPVDNEGEPFCCCPGSDAVEQIGAKRGGPAKIGEEMADVTSTGRKRAAVLFPIEEGMACEWQGLKFAGGGALPIVGCVKGLATDRHHGPDKSTLNNEPGNVHRICATCHNRWHTRNDPVYGPRPDAGRPFVPLGENPCLAHDSETKATALDTYESEMYWSANKLTRRVS